MAPQLPLHYVHILLLYCNVIHTNYYINKYYITKQFKSLGLYHKSMTFCTLLTLNKVMKSHYTYSSPSSVHQYTKSHANCAETVKTELYCVYLGVRISVSIERNHRNMSITIHCAFSKTMKIRLYRCKCDCLYTAVTPPPPLIHTESHTNNTHNHTSRTQQLQ